MSADQLRKMLFVILVSFGIDQRLDELATSSPVSNGESSITWLNRKVEEQSDLKSAIIECSLERLSLRRQNTSEVIVVEMSNSVFFVIDVRENTIRLENPWRKIETRKSVFRESWNGIALVVSDKPIVKDSSLDRWGAGFVALIAGSLIALAVLVFVYNRLRTQT